MTRLWVCKLSNRASDTSGAGPANPSGVHEFAAGPANPSGVHEFAAGPANPSRAHDFALVTLVVHDLLTLLEHMSSPW
jgi:hypothetical protein